MAAESPNLLRIDVSGSYSVPRVWAAVATCVVREGSVVQGDEVEVVRAGVVFAKGPVAGLRRYKESVSEVGAGSECGIAIDGCDSYEPGDLIVAAG
jgi:translation initiation factor IF-2